MARTRLTKRGICWYRWDGDRRIYIEHRVSNVHELLSCWYDPIEAEGNLTFGDLMGILRDIAPEDDEHLNRLLNAELGTFLQEAFSSPSRPSEATGLSRLEVYWDVDIQDEDGQPTYHEAVDAFQAWGPPEDPAEGTDDIPWSVSMTPLCELMHLPLVFNSTWHPQDTRKEGEGHPMEAIERPFTLGWALRTIFMDLGFYGNPAERARVKAEIWATVEELDHERGENLAEWP